MNRADYMSLLDEIMHELKEENGTFRDTFGAKTEEELGELRCVAAIALMAADRYYSRQTKMAYAMRYDEEVHAPKEG
ncbi:MAG: hypothetical protein E7604_06480 [Ruminococcaceae bacterium]|nr:hypothetical protein [Oscillospiraceae bacterium]